VKSLPNFYYENLAFKKGHRLILGLDEAGRGAWAGPLVCAAAAFFPHKQVLTQAKEAGVKINDSKKLTALQREKACLWIKKNALTWGVGVVSVAEINRWGISKATFSGFRRAIKNAQYRLDSRVDFILIDAFYVPFIRGINMPRKMTRKANRYSKRLKIEAGQLALIHGDERSFSIAAASILAKVHRDKLMRKLALRRNYQKYFWSKNKGYGTKEHIAAIRKFGLTCHHRHYFLKSLANQN